MDFQTLSVFTGVVFVLALLPGPDNLFISAQALAHGRLAGMAAAAGIITGGVTWTLAATFGVTAAFASVPMLLHGIQLAGAVYLCWLAYQLLRDTQKQTGAAPPPVHHAFGKALATNLLNPKVGLYYLALLPQFVHPEAGPVWRQMLILGLTFNVVGGGVMMGFGLLAGQARSFARGAAHVWLMRLAALILIALAANMVWKLFG